MLKSQSKDSFKVTKLSKMKNTLLICILCFFALKAIAQEPIVFDRNGKARLSANLAPNSVKAYTLEGDTFRCAAFKFRRLNGIQYTIARGNEVIFSGNTDEDFVKFYSDKYSLYTLTLHNRTQNVRGFIIDAYTATDDLWE